VTELDWVTALRQPVDSGGDVVDVARVIADVAVPRGEKYMAANALREAFGLSIRQVTAVLGWVEGALSDQELREDVSLPGRSASAGGGQ